MTDRIAALDVRDIGISTPDIEDVFLRFYDPAGRSSPEEAAEQSIASAGPGR